MKSMKQCGGLIRVAAGVAVIAMVGLTGCEEKSGSGTTGGLGQQLGDVASKAGKAASDAGNQVGSAVAQGVDAAKDAGTQAVDAAKDAGTQAVDAAKQGVDQLRTQATAWITDTVEKEWPKAKEALAGLEQRVAGLAPEMKGQAQTLLNDLKAQVPAIEETVAKMRNASGTELQGLMTNARTMWDGFMTKLGELRKMVGA